MDMIIDILAGEWCMGTKHLKQVKKLHASKESTLFVLIHHVPSDILGRTAVQISVLPRLFQGSIV